MEATAKAAKATSTYKKGKDESMKTKVEEKSKNQTQSQGQTDKVCWGCGNKDIHSKRNKPNDQSNDKDSKCGMCGYKHPMGQCWAKEATCHKCGKMGHLKSVCRSKPEAPQAGSRAGCVKVVVVDVSRLNLLMAKTNHQS